MNENIEPMAECNIGLNHQRALEMVNDKVAMCHCLMASLNEGLSVQDLDLRIVFQNKYLIDLFGDRLGEYCYSVYEKKTKECDHCPMRAAFNDGQAHQGIRVWHVNGQAFRVECNITLLRDKEGKVVAGVETARIVEDREKAFENLSMMQKELLSQKAELERILDYIPGLVFYKDTRNHFIKVNRYIADAHHLTKDRIEGKNLAELYPREDAEKYFADDCAVLKSGKPRLHIEEPWDTDSGRLWVDTSKIPVYDEHGNATGILGLSFDITEKRKVFDLFMESAAFNEILMDNSPYGMLLYDDTGQCIKANMAAANILGARIEQLLDQNYHTIDSWKKSGLYETVNTVFAAGEPRSFTCDLHTSFGKDLTVEFRIISLSMKNSPHLLLKFVDVSHYVKTQKMLESKSLELERSNAELEQFAYGVSHDLQEPLRKIGSFLELLKESHYDRIDDDGKEYIRIAVDGAMRMKDLINDLLAYSRIVRSTGPVILADSGAALKKALDDLDYQIRESHAVITVEKDTMPKVLVNQSQLVQLFTNLIHNAIKYRNPTVPPAIVIHASFDNVKNGWTIFITDNGIGIEEKYYSKIFKLFQRLHGKNKYGGTGIGLAICQRIVQQHGGEIGVTSRLNEGSTFHFFIPQGDKLHLNRQEFQSGITPSQKEE
jgi:PAS domain S-box-containing protein